MGSFLEKYSVDRALITTVLMDFVVVCGVLLLDWDPVRTLAFYYIELASFIFAFAIFMTIREGWWYLIMNLFGALIFILLLHGMFFELLKVWHNENESLILNYSFSPYFDFSIFLVLLADLRIRQVRKYLAYPPGHGWHAISYTFVAQLLLIPGLIGLSGILNYFFESEALSIILALFVFRTLAELMRRYYLRKFRPDQGG